MLNIQNLSLEISKSEFLFQNANVTLNEHELIALVGVNGVGKSSLLKYIANNYPDLVYSVPQHYGQFDELSIAEVLNVNKKLNAISQIEKGNTDEYLFDLIKDDWDIEDRVQVLFSKYNLNHLSINSKLKQLSGGERTKVFLLGIELSKKEFILMDEPSNHLDEESRNYLYSWLAQKNKSVLVVSHDVNLLQLCDKIIELTPLGTNVYGGNYDFYVEQKNIELEALGQKINHLQKEFKKEEKKAKDYLQSKAKQESHSEKRHEKRGTDKIQKNAMKENAQQSLSSIKSNIQQKMQGLSSELSSLREKEIQEKSIKTDFESSALPKQKIILKVENLNYQFLNGINIFPRNLDLTLQAQSRLAILGNNGSGKSTLLKLILGELSPTEGSIKVNTNKIVYIDQNYSGIKRELSIYEQAESVNKNGLEEHEIKLRLNRFLFDKDTWQKPCKHLSGGEMLRLSLCCMMIEESSPELFILDEPTNNLDLRNLEILTSTLQNYKGCLLLVSHDKSFRERVQINLEFRI